MVIAADKKFGGNSMTGRLERVAVCSPLDAHWSDEGLASQWARLGYDHRPAVAEAEAEHQQLCNSLEKSEIEVLRLSTGVGTSLDSVFIHDPSFVAECGAILLRMGRETRVGESDFHREMYKQQGIPVYGRIEPPGTVESGDLVWLDCQTLLVGCGYRTNVEGIQQLSRLLGPVGVEVISAPLPHARGPSFCLHLMSILSMLGPKTVLVDLQWLSVTTVELLRERSYQFIEIDCAERDLLACNVLVLREGRLLAFEETPKTRLRLIQAGFDVVTVKGAEMGINGGGGPTCLTRPILRR